MKTAIVGSGVAGSLLAAELCKRGHQVTLFEKNQATSSLGYGFVIMPNGKEGMDALDQWKNIQSKANPITHLQTQNSLQQQLSEFPLSDVFAFSREYFVTELIQNNQLENLIQYTTIEVNDEGQLSCDGKTIEDDFDWIVGCDGSFSQVRTLVAPEAHIELTQSYEITGWLDSPVLLSELGDRVYKILFPVEGLSLGILGLKQENRVLWFLQVDRNLHGEPTDSNHIMDFVASHLDTYSHPWVKQVVNHTALSYIWKCKTLMNIDRYAHGKYVLMGDAAHVYIPFTSQGTNQAIEDVQTWVNLLDQGLNQEEMNERYNALRVNKAQGLVNEGIQFAARFCNGPTDFMIDQIPLVFAND